MLEPEPISKSSVRTLALNELTSLSKGLASSFKDVILHIVPIRGFDGSFLPHKILMFLIFLTIRRKMSQINLKYEEAVSALNCLQSNAAILEKIRKQRQIFKSNNLVEMDRYCKKVGLFSEVINKLPIIHVAGTKGKGSTCAFIEHILREYGYRTGFYSSPHLVAVRERIRINGTPIDKKEFVHHFWNVYNLLKEKKTSKHDMPAYFKFLTILAFEVFIKSEVDVAIFEVGIGGEFDCTNIINNPIVCGITSLGFDHTSQLGDNIESIAWHKSGIIKNNVSIFTVPHQPVEAMHVIRQRAADKQSTVVIVPELENYDWRGQDIKLGLAGHVQFLNASLALQISNYFMKSRKFDKLKNSQNDNTLGKPFTLSDIDIHALKNVVWPGRSQILKKGPLTYFLDGAHTIGSIEACIGWYSKTIASSDFSRMTKTYKVLVFNITGDRDYESILKCLIRAYFDAVIFTTNMSTVDMESSKDQKNFTISEVVQIAKCQKLRSCWKTLQQNIKKLPQNVEKIENNSPNNHENGKDVDKIPENRQSNRTNLNNTNKISESFKNNSKNFKNTEKIANIGRNTEDLEESGQLCITFNCIGDVISWLNGSVTSPNSENSIPYPDKFLKANEIHVLVTGSLHLVGGFLGILDQNLYKIETT